jgi:hypothetical protein
MKEALWKTVFPNIYNEIRLRYPPEIANEASLIFLACKEKLISSETYLNWALPHYAIAILEDHFFTQHLNETLFQNYSSKANWNEEFYPVIEWDDVLFVACMDPYVLERENFKFEVRPLLTSYENLCKGWEILNKKTKPPMILQTPESIENDNNLLPLIDEVSNEELNDVTEAISPEDKIDLIENFAEPELVTQNIPELNKSTTKQIEQVELPEGFIDQPSDIVTTADGTEIEDPLLQLEAQINQDALLLKEELPALPVHPMEVPLPAVPPPAAPTNQILETGLPKKTPNFPEPPPLPVNPSTENESDQIQTGTSSINAELTIAIKETLSHAYNYYNRLMILIINSNETVTPIYWDQHFKPKSATHPIPLFQASPFRIAYKTGKPFHGSVYTNHILKVFTMEWLNEHPIHILTIIPLIENNNVFALLLGIADTDIDLKDSLLHFFKVAENTSKQISNSENFKVA